MRAAILAFLLSILLCLNVKAAYENEHANEFELTHEAMKSSIRDVTHVLTQDYVSPEKAALVVQHLKRQAVIDQLLNEKTWGAFAQKLGVLLREISGDGYFNITTSDADFTLGHTSLASHQAVTNSGGIEQVEVLSGNIGYFKLNHFYHHQAAKIQVAKAFEALSNTEAMILDLRDADGESILLAQYIMSYFVEQGTLLSHIAHQGSENMQALPVVEGLSSPFRQKQYPVYILTSAFVTGTGELISYTLKQLNKAVVVGAKTMGVATIVETQQVNEQLNITLPIAFYMSPITQTNWEGEGVLPDYDIDAKQSINAAYNLALKSIVKK